MINKEYIFSKKIDLTRSGWGNISVFLAMWYLRSRWPRVRLSCTELISNPVLWQDQGCKIFLSVIINIFQLLPFLDDYNVKNIFSPDVDCIFKTELVVIVGEEMANGRVIPSNHYRVRFCL